MESYPAVSVLSDDERAFQGAVADFARGEVGPRVAAMERASKLDPELIPKYFEMGLMGIQVPESLGGAGGSVMMVTIAVEEISRVDASAAIMVDVQNTLVAYPFLSAANDDQKQRYLPGLCESKVGAYALSEATSGSDAFAMQTRAEQRGGDWVLTGRKLWITNGAEGGQARHSRVEHDGTDPRRRGRPGEQRARPGGPGLQDRDRDA
jgi:alkylation response protein AidB-like acyl-CoA dehydrogenase